MRCKRGGVGIGEGIGMIVKMFLLSVIAVGVFSLSVLFYEYHVDVRDAEARILAREMTECLAGTGVLDLDRVDKKSRDEIMVYCGFGDDERFYVGFDIVDGNDDVLAKLEQGDSGSIWVRDLFDKAEGLTGNAVAGDAAQTVDNI